jgi:hypothetical protein
MDLSNFDPREAAETGIQVELKIDGEVIYGDDDAPITFTIKGVADPDVQEAMLKARGAPEYRTAEEVYNADMRLARVAVVDWSDNFDVRGQKLPFSKANLGEVFKNPVVRRAILAEVFREANFMPKR